MDPVVKENTHVAKGSSHSHKAPVHGRKFDRKSGTGRRDSTKRSGKGAYNWGCDYEMYEEDIKVAHNEI
eukprot:CAMPEP_0117756464 /NCGR_PEP_ID=MMETSP0947-20121206/14098_1 /TAXON_ID=44440 /ORGANISM="Chattonella subsalsa, Strain CCMP2191" /LENGTH=68 /DNA_ID=CAMNT_0005576065 /DNA_START=189 /DNA_END=395 /DNA_ORIENTATION=+